ncbi:MAG TPA: hypothetical protein VMD04_03470 [Candidatus Margulisiibacteriota bacterium]|nr:hypothetical protein [Candidatus Margulisiibacteriota bacterium]
MLIAIAYDRDYLRDPSSIATLQQFHASFLKIGNTVEKPIGKRIFMPVFVNLSRHFYIDKVNFVRLHARADKLFLFFSLIGFNLLLLKLGYDFKSSLIGVLSLICYMMFAFANIIPIWRFADMPNLMFFIWGLYFLISDFRILFLLNLLCMTFNKEISILLILILIIKVMLDKEAAIKKHKFPEFKTDFIYVVTSILLYIAVQLFLEKVVNKSIEGPCGELGCIACLSVYSRMNVTINGFNYLFNLFNFLIIIAFVNFFKNSNFIKASVFVIYLYILSVYLVGAVFKEGAGLFMPVTPILILSVMEGLKGQGIL